MEEELWTPALRRFIVFPINLFCSISIILECCENSVMGKLGNASTITLSLWKIAVATKRMFVLCVACRRQRIFCCRPPQVQLTKNYGNLSETETAVWLLLGNGEMHTCLWEAQLPRPCHAIISSLFILLSGSGSPHVVQSTKENGNIPWTPKNYFKEQRSHTHFAHTLMHLTLAAVHTSFQ